MYLYSRLSINCDASLQKKVPFSTVMGTMSYSRNLGRIDTTLYNVIKDNTIYTELLVNMSEAFKGLLTAMYLWKQMKTVVHIQAVLAITANLNRYTLEII